MLDALLLAARLLAPLGLCAGPDAAPAPAADTYRVELTNDPLSRAPATTFKCSQKIFAYLHLPKPEAGKHTLGARWYRPDGQLQEDTKVAVNEPPPGSDTMYLWLKLAAPEEADTVDIFFGAGDSEDFDGRWRVDFFWDDRKVQTAGFQVSCS